MDVAEWLRNLGLEQYAPAFRENKIDGRVLPDLNAEDLKDLGVSLVGHRRQLLKAISALSTGATPAAVSPISAPTPDDRLLSLHPGAERRQLSVMFCDLVDSTPLSARLDPEDLGEVIRGYQARVAETVARFGGFIALYVGDGVLIYFGWPEAHEADAERAARAALAVVASVGETPVRGERLKVRIGIATGLVVVGEEIGIGKARQQAVVGETPNRAARLQGLAGPDGVAIDAATRQQIGGLFECRDLGAVALKGLPEPVHTWLVQGESGVASRFEALRASQLTALIGREEELDLLLRRWRQAVRGEGKVVLLTGEPGIGKSRLIAALEERLQGEACTWLKYFCSPHHQESPLHPIIGQLERAAGFTRGDMAADKFGKLKTLLAATATSDEDTALLADLLSIPTEGVLPALNLSPQRRKERTFEALLHQVVVLARAKPVLMLLEDSHWVDPSSRELFDLVVERLAGLPVLLVMTFRPEFQAPWIGRAGVSLLTLSRFDRQDTETMTIQVAACAIPAELIERIVAQTDGVPLFIEELTRAVLEAGLSPAGDASRLAVPETLQASLIARLDQIPAAKTVAQIGAVIGRSFSHELIAAVAQLPEPALWDGLQQLVGSGLALQRGVSPEATYTFKHALVQDTVYQSLLRGKRATLHGRIVAVLRTQDPGIEEKQPDLLAHHCEQAGFVEQAIDYYLKAGQLALTRSAHDEAIVQLQKGVQLLSGVSDDVTRRSKEIDLQLALGSAFRAAKGNGSPEAGRAFDRARELCRLAGETPRLVSALGGVWVFELNRAELAASIEAATELLRCAKEEGDAVAEMLGNRCAAISWMFRGAFAAACTHAAQAFASHATMPRNANSPADEVTLGAALSHPIAGLRSMLSWALLFRGYFDQALSEHRQALAVATHSSHPHVLAITLHQSCVFHHLAMNLPEVEQHSATLIALATEHNFPHWLASGVIFRGWCRAAAGEREAGLAEMRRGLTANQATGSQILMPYWLGLIGSVSSDTASATSLLDDALVRVDKTGERWFEAELHRLQGELLLRSSSPAFDKAEVRFKRALAIAREQGAKLSELRAAMNLARLWCEQDRRKAAGDLLAPVYNWFTEGFDMPDLKHAKALLDELA